MKEIHFEDTPVFWRFLGTIMQQLLKLYFPQGVSSKYGNSREPDLVSKQRKMYDQLQDNKTLKWLSLSHDHYLYSCNIFHWQKRIIRLLGTGLGDPNPGICTSGIINILIYHYSLNIAE